MKIQIKDRYFHDTNSTTDKWVTEIHEYEPTLEDAKEWAKEEEGNGQGQLVFIQLVTETTSVDVIDKYVPRIEKEYERLLSEEMEREINEHGFAYIIHKYFSKNERLATIQDVESSIGIYAELLKEKLKRLNKIQ
jgi:hypothetical protein